MTLISHSKNVRLRDCPEDCDGNHKASVIDTQKLRQQLAEATPYGGGAYQLINELPRKEDAEFVLFLIAQAPALLDELDAAKNELERLKKANLKLHAQVFVNKYGEVIEKLAKE